MVLTSIWVFINTGTPCSTAPLEPWELAPANLNPMKLQVQLTQSILTTPKSKHCPIFSRLPLLARTVNSQWKYIFLLHPGNIFSKEYIMLNLRERERCKLTHKICLLFFFTCPGTTPSQAGYHCPYLGNLFYCQFLHTNYRQSLLCSEAIYNSSLATYSLK